MGPFVDWKQLSKDSLSVRISHYKALELKSKEKTDWQRQDGGPRDNYKRRKGNSRRRKRRSSI